MTSGVHSAAASAAGYQYQTRWALLNLLREAKHRPELVLTLEMHDDVAWEDAAGDATELLQTKLHANASAGLGDKDTDIWKTLLIWLKRDDHRDPDGPALGLVTTSCAAEGTAAYALRPSSACRDVHLAVALLSAAAVDSSAKATAEGRSRFMALSEAERTTFLQRVRVLDQELQPEDVEAAVRSELTYVLPLGEKPQQQFLAQVWAWWDGVSVDLLRRNIDGIAASQVIAWIQELRNDYGPEGLRSTVERTHVTEQDIESHMQDRFVEQMRLVSYPTRNLRKAVVDYHRAVTQETHWLANSLLGLHELQRFEENLRDEWDRTFVDMLDELGEDLDTVSEETKQAAGKTLLRSLLDSTAVSVRQHYTDPFFARGKRHELADRSDELGIGWHPEFATRLAAAVAQPA